MPTGPKVGSQDCNAGPQPNTPHLPLQQFPEWEMNTSAGSDPVTREQKKSDRTKGVVEESIQPTWGVGISAGKVVGMEVRYPRTGCGTLSARCPPLPSNGGFATDPALLGFEYVLSPAPGPKPLNSPQPPPS